MEAKQQARHAYAPFEVPGEVRALFSVLDADQNGQIDYFEFRRLMDELDDWGGEAGGSE